MIRLPELTEVVSELGARMMAPSLEDRKNAQGKLIELKEDLERLTEKVDVVLSFDPKRIAESEISDTTKVMMRLLYGERQGEDYLGLFEYVRNNGALPPSVLDDFRSYEETGDWESYKVKYFTAAITFAFSLAAEHINAESGASRIAARTDRTIYPVNVLMHEVNIDKWAGEIPELVDPDLRKNLEKLGVTKVLLDKFMAANRGSICAGYVEAILDGKPWERA